MDFKIHISREKRAGKTRVIALVLVSVIVLISALYFLKISSPGDIFEYNQTAIEYLMTEYELSEEGAFILSLTEIHAEKISESQYQISAKFPTENYVNITITFTPLELQPIQFDDTNQSIFDYTFSYMEDDDEFSFQLEYTIPYSAIPEEMLKELNVGTKASKNSPIIQTVSYQGIAPVLDSIEEKAFRASIKAVVKKFVSGKVSDFEKNLGKSAGSKILEKGTLTTTYGAVSSILSSWKIKGHHESWMIRLKTLRDCAENPTNRLTKKAYEDDPDYKERILKEIDSAINEIETNTAARFLNAINSIAVKRLGKAAPWLGWVVAPLAAWSDTTLDEVSEENVRWVESMVVPCTEEEIDKENEVWSGSIKETRITKRSMEWSDVENSFFDETYIQEVTITGVEEISIFSQYGTNIFTGELGSFEAYFVVLNGDIVSSYQMRAHSSWLEHQPLSGEYICEPQIFTSYSEANGQGGGEATVSFTLSQIDTTSYFVLYSDNFMDVTQNDRETGGTWYIGESDCTFEKEERDLPQWSYELSLGMSFEVTIDYSNLDVIQGTIIKVDGDTEVTITWNLRRGNSIG